MNTQIAEITCCPDFEIYGNPNYNTMEVSFSEKPGQAVCKALKKLKLRWNPYRKVWYGYAEEQNIRKAILESNKETESVNEIPSAVVAPGYLGATAIYGSKSHLHLYGAALTNAIRDDFKKHHLKATVRKYEYSGGTSITVTVTMESKDYIPFDRFKEVYELNLNNWIYDEQQKPYSFDEYQALSAERKEAIRIYNATTDYNNIVYSKTVHVYADFEKYKLFSPSGLKKLQTADALVSAYRYDDSNSMVDYFDTNFYYDIWIKNI